MLTALDHNDIYNLMTFSKPCTNTDQFATRCRELYADGKEVSVWDDIILQNDYGVDDASVRRAITRWRDGLILHDTTMACLQEALRRAINEKKESEKQESKKQETTTPAAAQSPAPAPASTP